MRIYKSPTGSTDTGGVRCKRITRFADAFTLICVSLCQVFASASGWGRLYIDSGCYTGQDKGGLTICYCPMVAFGLMLASLPVSVLHNAHGFTAQTITQSVCHARHELSVMTCSRWFGTWQCMLMSDLLLY